MDNFLIIRLSSLGDIIHTLPAFSSLRTHFPSARILWAVEGNGKEILDLVPGIDEIVLIPRKGWYQSIKRIRNRDQVALDFQGLLKSAALASLSRSARRIGFHRKNLKEPMASLLYTETLDQFPEEESHVISKNLRLLGKLGIHEDLYEFPIQIPEKLRDGVRQELNKLGYKNGRKLVIFNMGAAWETKRWSPENWIKVVDKMDNSTIFPLLLWGNEIEKDLARAVSDKTEARVAPFFSLKEVISLIQEAALLVSGDTFALQAACALSVPVVGIFGPTNPRRNGPFSPRDTVVYSRLECSPCYKRTCSTLECLEKISPDEVADSALQLLRGEHVS